MADQKLWYIVKEQKLTLGVSVSHIVSDENNEFIAVTWRKTNTSILGAGYIKVDDVQIVGELHPYTDFKWNNYMACIIGDLQNIDDIRNRMV